MVDLKFKKLFFKGNEFAPSSSHHHSMKGHKKRGRKTKKKNLVPNREQVSDPHANSSADLCQMLGLIDVQFEYNEEDFEIISSGKVF